MTNLTQLETCVSELATAVKTLTCYSPDIPGEHYHESRDAPRARQSALALTSQIQALIGGPPDFLQRLATQVSTYSHHHRYFHPPAHPCRSPTIISLHTNTEIPSEPTARLYPMAWGIPSSRLYSPQRQRPDKGCLRLGRRPGASAEPRHSHDGYSGISH